MGLLRSCSARVSGPPPICGAWGIPVVFDLPGVGANLHDHPTAVRSFAAAPALARELDAGRRVPDEQVVAKLSTGLDPTGAPYDLHVFPWTEPDPTWPAGRAPIARSWPTPADAEQLAVGLPALDPILAKLPLGEELG